MGGKREFLRKLKRTSILSNATRKPCARAGEKGDETDEEKGTGGKVDRGKERGRFQANWKNTGKKAMRSEREKRAGVQTSSAMRDARGEYKNKTEKMVGSGEENKRQQLLQEMRRDQGTRMNRERERSLISAKEDKGRFVG